jgi:hypothetical protein
MGYLDCASIWRRANPAAVEQLRAAWIPGATPARILFSEWGEGAHMSVVTSAENRSESRTVYAPPNPDAMAHRSYLSPDRKQVWVVEMAGDWRPCRLVRFEGSAPRSWSAPHRPSAPAGTARRNKSPSAPPIKEGIAFAPDAVHLLRRSGTGRPRCGSMTRAANGRSPRRVTPRCSGSLPTATPLSSALALKPALCERGALVNPLFFGNDAGIPRFGWRHLMGVRRRDACPPSMPSARSSAPTATCIS